MELINLSTDYVHIRKEQNIAEWKKVDKCENASKELKEAAEVSYEYGKSHNVDQTPRWDNTRCKRTGGTGKNENE